MVWWTIMVFGTETIGAIAQALDRVGFQALNFVGQYHNAGTLLFHTTARLDISAWISLLVAAGWTLLAIWVLRKRIRPVEVVS
jgi:hypothetical protein